MDSINKNRLFFASCVALTVTSMTFSIRAGILDQLGVDFELSKSYLGWINSMAFLGFPVAMIIGGLLYNSIGPKKLMWVAFIGHLLGLVLTIFAGGFWGLIISTFFIGFANGAVEAACNPMIAEMYPENKTTMLNKFHVWFPGGIVLGALIAKFMGDAGLDWQLQIAIMIIPTIIYGVLILGQKFPETEALEADTSQNVKSMLSTPLFFFIAICMTITATSELGTQQWVNNILGNQGANPMLILALWAGIMAVGRFFAGPIIHKFNPVGVLWGSAIISTVGIFLLLNTTGTMTYLATAVFAIGLTYFWPTMIGFVGEYLPKTGALGMSIVGGFGMFGVSIWNPIIGKWLDNGKLAAEKLGMKAAEAEAYAGQQTLDNLAWFPAALILLFGILYFYMRGRNFKPVT